jgi:uncharacterized protein YcbK (DUF882 family)
MDWSTVRYFDREEFGYADDIEPDESFVRMLDDARHLAGMPFELTSAIRTVEHNEEVGGVPDSAHLSGQAVDILCESSRARFLILSALLEVGFTRFGVADSFVHVDVDDGKPQEVVWVYS